VKQFLIIRADTVRKHTFESINPRDSYALSAKENCRLAMDFAGLKGKSALFTGKDCFECLSPHISAA